MLSLDGGSAGVSGSVPIRDPEPVSLVGEEKTEDKLAAQAADLRVLWRVLV